MADVGPTVDRGLEQELIARVFQLGAPPKADVRALRRARERGQKRLDVRRSRAGAISLTTRSARSDGWEARCRRGAPSQRGGRFRSMTRGLPRSRSSIAVLGRDEHFDAVPGRAPRSLVGVPVDRPCTLSKRSYMMPGTEEDRRNRRRR
jgi:hypothetical protein